jgi:hypothetical protein
LSYNVQLVVRDIVLMVVVVAIAVVMVVIKAARY